MDYDYHRGPVAGYDALPRQVLSAYLTDTSLRQGVQLHISYEPSSIGNRNVYVPLEFARSLFDAWLHVPCSSSRQSASDSQDRHRASLVFLA